MNNFRGSGEMVTVPAPSGGLTGGQGYLVDAMFGIVAKDTLEGDDAELKLTGCFTLPKVSAQAWGLGQPIYWDTTPGQATTAAPGNVLIGVAIAEADNPSSYGDVRLNGAFAIEPQT